MRVLRRAMTKAGPRISRAVVAADAGAHSLLLRRAQSELPTYRIFNGLRCKTLQTCALKVNANLGVCKTIGAGRRSAPYYARAALSSPGPKLALVTLMYGPAVRGKRFRQLRQMRSCVNVSGL